MLIDDPKALSDTGKKKKLNYAQCVLNVIILYYILRF